MKTILNLIFLFLLITSPVLAQHQDHAKNIRSEYAGQEKRPIKSLSDADIKALSEGQGWGLAKAAELNGVPGPRHVLDMKEQLKLGEAQTDSIQRVFEDMRSSAIQIGKDILRQEKELDNFFASGASEPAKMEEMVVDLGRDYGMLRAVHLKAHLQILSFLTSEQVDRYNELRGYGSSDPCSAVPEGHDPKMWKMHNGCDQ